MTNKTEAELRNEVEKQQQQKFIDEVRELEIKHGYRLIAQMNYTNSGAFAQLGLQKAIKEKTEVDLSNVVAEQTEETVVE
jgi:hypothetical protein